MVAWVGDWEANEVSPQLPLADQLASPDSNASSNGRTTAWAVAVAANHRIKERQEIRPELSSEGINVSHKER